MTSTARNIVRIAAVGLLAWTPLVLSCRRGPVQIDSGLRPVMGTFVRIVVLAPDEIVAEACITAAFAEQDGIESLMSYQREDSELSRLNRQGAAEAVRVSDSTFEVIRQACHYSELSDGAFDVTVGPLMDLWHAAADANRPPSDMEMAAARQKVGWRKLVLDANASTVRFLVSGMKVDLGGIAKGYAIDRSVEAMRLKGALGGMVDLGGNVRCFGLTPQGQSQWYIAIQDPNVGPDDQESGHAPAILQIREGSVSTSGHYRRFVAVAGRRQSHIVDPNTGADDESLASVTVIAPDATSADALSTAVIVMGRRRGIELIEGLPGTEVILIPAGPDAKPILSQGAAGYIRQGP
jgi:FAD:protein FMN transferase